MTISTWPARSPAWPSAGRRRGSPGRLAHGCHLGHHLRRGHRRARGSRTPRLGHRRDEWAYETPPMPASITGCSIPRSSVSRSACSPPARLGGRVNPYGSVPPCPRRTDEQYRAPDQERHTRGDKEPTCAPASRDGFSLNARWAKSSGTVKPIPQAADVPTSIGQLTPRQTRHAEPHDNGGGERDPEHLAEEPRRDDGDDELVLVCRCEPMRTRCWPRRTGAARSRSTQGCSRPRAGPTDRSRRARRWGRACRRRLRPGSVPRRLRPAGTT